MGCHGLGGERGCTQITVIVLKIKSEFKKNYHNPNSRKLNLFGTGVSLKSLTKLLNACKTLESLNLTSCRALPRGMKRMYHNKEDVDSLTKDIADGKFDPKDAGSDDDD